MSLNQKAPRSLWADGFAVDPEDNFLPAERPTACFAAVAGQGEGRAAAFAFAVDDQRSYAPLSPQILSRSIQAKSEF
jgi:hypothetical protein